MFTFPDVYRMRQNKTDSWGRGYARVAVSPVHTHAPTACYRRYTRVLLFPLPFANLHTSPIIRGPLYAPRNPCAIFHPTTSRVVERRVVRRSPRVVLGNGRTARRKVYNMHLLVALARVTASTRFRIPSAWSRTHSSSVVSPFPHNQRPPCSP